ncbi:heme-dependent oxidative N-demethylase subunit alpha family protein, partial [Mesorhizobium sp.]|uniref:heme-dependent oxidative N-demethylase subunit alpha family protein n=1 Tax=Mesorhizobium sp. TaxID=1871066 RepID=UPI0025BD553A
MSRPAHTPYDGSSKPFTIGLKPLGLDQWLDVDENLPAHLAEKRRLYAEIPEKVFVEEDGTREAQQEVLDLVVAYLAAKHPGTHRGISAGVEVIGAESGGGPTAALREAPLVRASLLVQEDLILMRRDESGWRLAAGSLCFPSF